MEKLYIKNIFKGILIIVFSFLFFISFPFKLIDLVIRLCFLLALFPIYVFFWTFPITRQFVGSAKTMLINLMFTFIALTILTVFGLRIIVTSTMGGNFDEMLRVMLDGKLKNYLEENAENGPGFFAIVMGLYMSTTLLDQAPALGSMIGQGTESGAIKNNTGAAAVAVAMKTASKAAGKIKDHYTKDAGGGD